MGVKLFDDHINLSYLKTDGIDKKEHIILQSFTT